MDNYTDRLRQRRRFVRKRVQIYACAAGRVVLTIGLCLILICGAMGMQYAMQSGGNGSHALTGEFPNGICVLVVIVIGCWANYKSQKFIEDAQDTVAKQFVPPVGLAEAAPQDVLVRGASRPSALRSELVRPAEGAVTDTADASLLRAHDRSERL